MTAAPASPSLSGECHGAWSYVGRESIAVLLYPPKLSGLGLSHSVIYDNPEDWGAGVWESPL